MTIACLLENTLIAAQARLAAQPARRRAAPVASGERTTIRFLTVVSRPG